jgi:hypothetical protein
MKYFLIFICSVLLQAHPVSGQISGASIEGKISYTTSKSVYVRFESTEAINIGDTLSLWQGNGWLPALVVRQKSSTSCVSDVLLPAIQVKVDQRVQFQKRTMSEKIAQKEADLQVEPVVTIDKEAEKTDVGIVSDSAQNKTEKERKQLINGRFTLTTNGMLNPGETTNFQRIRAAFSMQVQHIHKSAFSLQTYVTYRYRYGIDQSTTDFYNDFKIFGLSLEYAPDRAFKLWAGRRINSYIANLGTIDGLQGEIYKGNYLFGAFAGTRPDFQNFSFNRQLPQFGIYAVRNDQRENGGSAQSTLAISEQQNNFRTDRRFMYFQHSNTLVKHLNLFVSSELDLYKKENGIAASQLSITSLYTSLRYRIRNNLSLTGSYDNRRNVIYYESYQTFIDQFLAQETRQGFRMQLNYTPFRFLNMNASAFYRYQGSNPSPTTNYVANIGILSLPGMFQTINFSINLLESYYFKGRILGARLNGQTWKGKLGIECNYRNVQYDFFNAESSLKQHIGGVSLTFNLLKKTALMLNYEGTFEPSQEYHRYFITFIQRFKN